MNLSFFRSFSSLEQYFQRQIIMRLNSETQEAAGKLWTVTQIQRDFEPRNTTGIELSLSIPFFHKTKLSQCSSSCSLCFVVDVFAARIQPKDANTLIRYTKNLFYQSRKKLSLVTS